MKRLFRTGICFLVVLSCTREIADPVSAPAVVTAGPDTEQDVRGAEVSELGIQAGVALVYLDETTTSRLEGGLAFDNLVPGLEVKEAERLFPHAGEYEPRTRREGLHRWYVVKYDKKLTLARAKEILEEIPGVQRVEPSRIARPMVTVNDPYWNNMWGMNNTAYPGFDVNCKPVWDNYTMGNPNVTVAVIDGGFQLNHPDLAANVAASGHYNYVSNNTNITQHFHGTHVAGTIAAVNNNGVGVTGIAGGNAAAGKPGVKLLSLQVFETRDNGYDAAAYDFDRALKEAADRGGIISQNSWGFNFDFNDNGYLDGNELNYARQAHENPERSFMQAVDYFIKYAGCDNNGNQLSSSPMKGGVVIFAAGNENVPYGAPGNYESCISVGAMDRNGSRASFSNYGDWVDICAPGVNIASTYLNGQYANMSGTSMACPHVSGVAALIVSHFGGKGFTADELRVRLLTGARTIGASTGSRPIGPLVDAWGSFNLNAQGGVPDPVSDLTVTPVGHNLRVDFTSTGAYAYLLLASTSKLAVQNADFKNPADNLIAVTRLASAEETEGVEMSIPISGLKASTNYYVAVVPYSYDGNYASLSDIVAAKTNENQLPLIEVEDYPEGGFRFQHYETVSYPVTCTDPDGDAITVSFRTNGRATFPSNNGSSTMFFFQLMAPLSNAGTFSATVEAVDEVGGISRRSIQYTVLPNTAPVQKKEADVLLLEEKGSRKVYSLDEYFSDPDGEPLFYRAASMDDAIATVTVEDGELVVTAISQGVCRVKVTAEDHAGERIEAELAVLVRLSGTPEVFLSGKTVLNEGEITVITGVEPASTTLRLISASGVVVYEHEGQYSALTPFVLNIDNLAPGIYTLEVIYKGQVYTFTIVKR